MLFSISPFCTSATASLSTLTLSSFSCTLATAAACLSKFLIRLATRASLCLTLDWAYSAASISSALISVAALSSSRPTLGDSWLAAISMACLTCRAVRSLTVCC